MISAQKMIFVTWLKYFAPSLRHNLGRIRLVLAEHMQTGNLSVCSRDFSRAPEEVAINTGSLWFVTPVLLFRPDLSAHPHPCHVPLLSCNLVCRQPMVEIFPLLSCSLVCRQPMVEIFPLLNCNLVCRFWGLLLIPWRS